MSSVGTGHPVVHQSCLAGRKLKLSSGMYFNAVYTRRIFPHPFSPANFVFSVDGMELGSTVSRDDYESRPFRFDGKINQVNVLLK